MCITSTLTLHYLCVFIRYKGRFLVMQVNHTPHLNHIQDIQLKTGGSLKDGWSYLMPQDEILLYNEVTSAFADELDDHVKEQTHALKNLYLSKQGTGGSFLMRKHDENDNNYNGDNSENANNDETESQDAIKNTKQRENEMTFVIQRGLQVAGCVTFNDQTGEMSDLVIRPSAKANNFEKELVTAVISHAKKQGHSQIISFMTQCHEDHFEMFKEVGFVYCQTDSSDKGMQLVFE